jgi:hypothetical protein
MKLPLTAVAVAQLGFWKANFLLQAESLAEDTA